MRKPSTRAPRQPKPARSVTPALNPYYIEETGLTRADIIGAR